MPRKVPRRAPGAGRIGREAGRGRWPGARRHRRRVVRYHRACTACSCVSSPCWCCSPCPPPPRPPARPRPAPCSTRSPSRPRARPRGPSSTRTRARACSTSKPPARRRPAGRATPSAAWPSWTTGRGRWAAPAARRRISAAARVRPDALERRYEGGLRETVTLLDAPAHAVVLVPRGAHAHRLRAARLRQPGRRRLRRARRAATCSSSPAAAPSPAPPILPPRPPRAGSP